MCLLCPLARWLYPHALNRRIGGAIGVLYTVGLSVATAFYVIGFASALVEQIPTSHSMTGSEINDIRVYGLLVVAVIGMIAFVGAFAHARCSVSHLGRRKRAAAVSGVDWVVKVQYWLLGSIWLAALSLFIGSFYQKDAQHGIVGWSSTVAAGIIVRGAAHDARIDERPPPPSHAANASPQWRDGYDFFGVLSVFFAEVSGFMSGANISGERTCTAPPRLCRKSWAAAGDLQDPSKAIPTGTLWGLLTTCLTYMGIVRGARGMDRHRPGVLRTQIRRDRPSSPGAASRATRPTAGSTATSWCSPSSPCGSRSCWVSPQHARLTRRAPPSPRSAHHVKPAVTAGIYAATFSSALSSLVGAPRVLQRLAADGIIPLLGTWAVCR